MCTCTCMCTLGSLWNHFGYMKVTFDSLWSVFKKTLIFPRDLNDLMQLGDQLWTHFGIEIAFALAFACACALEFALKLRLHLNLHLHLHLNLHLHGRIRFWTAPCAKITRLPMDVACRSDPGIIATRCKPLRLAANRIRTTPNVTNLLIHVISSSLSIYLSTYIYPLTFHRSP